MSSLPSTDAEQFDISNLPPEILPRIFTHLSVDERKAAKLVCKSWFKGCNSLSLLEDEVLLCLGIYQLSDTYELIDKSERKFLNLKFENVKFDHGSSFWENNGPRIRSMYFKDCLFPNGIFEEIIIFCGNLFHLSITYTALLQYITNDRDSLPPIKDLENVPGKGIVREKLKSLELYIINSNWILLSDYLLHQLLLIFPKIKILKITSDFCPAEEVDLNLSEFTNRNHVTISPIINFVQASAERIENLKLDFSSAKFSSKSLRCILETVSSLNRLTQLSICTRNTLALGDVDVFLRMKQLKSLQYCMEMRPYDLISFLSQLLSSHSDLQYLKIHQYYKSLRVTKAFYEKLMSSKLKTCSVIASQVSIEDPESFGSSIVAENVAPVLPSLSVRMTFPQRDFVPFLQYYRNLHHLHIDRISYEELQFLLKYQKTLKSLKIRSEQWMDYFKLGPDDFGNVFNQLADIECLEFIYAPIGAFFLKTQSAEPILAKLKYLSIDAQTVDKTVFASELLRSVDSMPYLEGLNVYNGKDISYDVCVELFTKLSRLRYFDYTGNWITTDGVLTDEHYHKLFSICPSLRALVHFNYPNSKTYFLDTINKKVVLKLADTRYHLGEPKIGEFTVSWLEF